MNLGNYTGFDGPDYDAFHAITVSIPSLRQTGFWVHPAYVITCAHGSANPMKEGDQLDVRCGELLLKASVVRFDKAADLILLTIPDHDPPPLFQLCKEVRPHDAVYSWGYTERNLEGGESLVAEIEGWSRSPFLLKLSKGMVKPGMSGAPLYSYRKESIVGMVSISRDRNAPSGGRAVAASTIMEVCGQLLEGSAADVDPSEVLEEDLSTVIGMFESAYESATPTIPVDRQILRAENVNWRDGEIMASTLRTILERHNEDRRDAVYKWFKANPQCLRFIVLEDESGVRRIGVTCVLPLRRNSFQIYRSGKLREFHFSDQDIVPTHEGGASPWLCFQSFAVSARYTRKTRKAVRAAFEMHVSKMTPASRLPIVIAEVGTKAGLAEAKHFGMKFIEKLSADDRPLFQLNLAER
ncbi:MAG: serine protease [Candidatus Zixiibacteriota bacterium]